MKKQYIKPTIATYTLNPVRNIFTGSIIEFGGDASVDYIEGDGNNDSREDNIFNDNRSVWDNAW